MRVDTVTEAAQTFADLVRRIPADRWDGHGLGDWNLRSLVGHTSRSLITVETYLQQPADRIDCPSAAAYYGAIAGLMTDAEAVRERGVEAGRRLGHDPSRTIDVLVERVLPLIDRDDDPVITTIAGGMRLSDYLPTRTVELVVHTRDITTATGLSAPEPSSELYAEVLGVLAGASVVRGVGLELLLALSGRQQLRPDFSVV